MDTYPNSGFDPAVISEYRQKINASGHNFVLDETDENNDEFVHFFFIGEHEGREVIYDSVMYTLRLHHESEVYEIAEQRASEHFPQYRKINYAEDESGNLEPLDPLEEEIGLFMAEVIMELEEEETVKVKEHVDLDENAEFGVSLDIGLHLEKIATKDIEKFVRDFNDDALKLDDTLYSFQIQDEEIG